jgi:integrase
MTIRQRGKEKICMSEFHLDNQVYRFSFNGKKGMPLITSKKEAKSYESELKLQMKAGTFVSESPMQNFSKFYNEVFMDFSKHHKSDKGHVFDEYYGRSLLAEFGTKKLSQITPRMIERFLLKLSKTKTRYDKFFSPVTVRMHYDRLNQTFNLAIRERVTNDNPCRLVSHTVLKDFPTWIKRERWLNKYSETEEANLFNELDAPLQTICAILLNTGLRPPQEILGIEKEHVNLSDESRYYRFKGQDVLLPPCSLFVARGKGGRTRTIPLNQTAQRIFNVLCGDSATGKWLFLNRDGKPLASIKKGFAAACGRAKISDLRPYDLRHTFATRLAERGVPMTPIISGLLGHSLSMAGFGFESRVTPGYAHATWQGMVRAVESLEHEPQNFSVFGSQSVKSQSNQQENKASGKEAKTG